MSPFTVGFENEVGRGCGRTRLNPPRAARCRAGPALAECGERRARPDELIGPPPAIALCGPSRSPGVQPRPRDGALVGNRLSDERLKSLPVHGGSLGDHWCPAPSVLILDGPVHVSSRTRMR